MYVGLTRAEDRLYLTHAFARTRYGDNEPSVPSQFLDDIPPELIGGVRRESRRGTAPRATTWPTAPAQPVRQLQYRAGQRVRHPVFGEGLVIESRRDGSDEMLTVHFEDVGLKRLIADMAPLEHLED